MTRTVIQKQNGSDGVEYGCRRPDSGREYTGALMRLRQQEVQELE
jgi:hypothetical protein